MNTRNAARSGLSRRALLATLAGRAAAQAARPVLATGAGDAAIPLPPAFAALTPLGARVRPIGADEYRQRLTSAQRLMGETAIGQQALLVAAGSSLRYFTGIRWWLSERLLALAVPRNGEPLLIVPAFEEGRLREQLPFPIEVRAWQEDESPYTLLAGALADRGIRNGTVGVDFAVPFAFYDRLRAAAPALGFASGDPVTAGCRARKSVHELELMRLACGATCEVFRAVFASLQIGMSQAQIAALVEAGFARMQLSGEALVLLGASAALPHGSTLPQTLREGEVVLIDGGCTVEGYQSDVTRTGVVGTPAPKVARAYAVVREAQTAALDAARAGRPAGSVDDAARAVITRAGFGSGYRLFTHRLGHGIGLDGHESPYLVHGSSTLLQPGMTFSNEPGIYVPGEYGVRCEDDMVISVDGPAELLTPRFQVSLERPLG